ncbi:hypothetical protein Cme02nite_41350 [Catellatospora methionotrophica]|uniref:Integral membrane protein n=1 Tax=Catellatospora methionotrophica TaxID=121620 RepID=A0A8J3L7G7_9ACTN|nr:hypothetical protein [Catellatospora methionotrophica]GIG15803.1 hypothetical protein Cme02nite_41350 [Catellatospora methionotrophica]
MTDAAEPSLSAWERRLADASHETREPSPPAVRRTGGGVRTLRWVGAFVLALLAAVLVLASVTARFARSELLDTDSYVETVAPLATDPQVQTAVTDRVTQEIMARLPLEKLAGDLAGAVNLPRVQSIIDLVLPAITSWLQTQIHKVVYELVTSPRFPVVWNQVNRAAHQNIEGLLTGQGTDLVHSSGTDIVVDLGPVLAAARQELVDRGFGLAARIPDMSIPYTVAQVDQLPEIQRYVRLLDVSANWLPPLALVLLGLAVWTAPNRRRGLILGLSLSALMLVVGLIANQMARDRVAERATLRGLDRSVTLDVYDTVLRFLVTALVAVLVAALLAVLWALLAGPSRPAVLLRRGVNAVVDRAVRPLARESWAVRTGAFVRRHFRWFAIALGVLVGWWLLARPSVATAVWAFVLAALATLLLTVARRTPATVLTPLPAGPPTDLAPATRPEPEATTTPVPTMDADTEPAADAPTPWELSEPMPTEQATRIASGEPGSAAERPAMPREQGPAGQRSASDEPPSDPTGRAVDP